MKKLIAVLVLTAGISAVAAAQKIAEANVPAAVVSKFNSTFTNSSDVSWELDYDNYVATFRNNKVDVEVTFNKDGKWISTETPVSHSALPASVKSCLTRQFDIYKENDIEKVDSPQGTRYTIDLESNSMNYSVVIADNGELVSREQVKEYKKEE